MAAFMEVLDTSIANVALPHIAGNLGASNDESTWVLTSYLVSNAVVLPISGFLVDRLGRKRFFLACIAFFTAQLVLCGIAPSLGLLLLFPRIARRIRWRVPADDTGDPRRYFPAGETGPGLRTVWRSPSFAPRPSVPRWAAGLPTTIPGAGFSISTFQWEFWPCCWFLSLSKIPLPVPPKKRYAEFDYLGFGLLAIGVGALQIALDKGQEDDWFGSRFITTLIVIAAVGLVSLVIWEWRHKEPVVDVRLFKMFNFASCNVMMFVLGMVLFSSTVLLPQFLQTLMGYTAETAGMVLSVAAILSLFFCRRWAASPADSRPGTFSLSAGSRCAMAMYYLMQALDFSSAFTPPYGFAFGSTCRSDFCSCRLPLPGTLVFQKRRAMLLPAL